MDEMLPMLFYAIVISNTIIVIYTYNIYIYIYIYIYIHIYILLTCLMSRWTGFYMLWLLMLESIFEWTVSLDLWKLFGVIVIFNAKFILDLGIVRIQRGFWILWCLWDVFIVSILKYVLKLLPVGTCVM